MSMSNRSFDRHIPAVQAYVDSVCWLSYSRGLCLCPIDRLTVKFPWSRPMSIRSIGCHIPAVQDCVRSVFWPSYSRGSGLCPFGGLTVTLPRFTTMSVRSSGCHISRRASLCPEGLLTVKFLQFRPMTSRSFGCRILAVGRRECRNEDPLCWKSRAMKVSVSSTPHACILIVLLGALSLYFLPSRVIQLHFLNVLLSRSGVSGAVSQTFYLWFNPLSLAFIRLLRLV